MPRTATFLVHGHSPLKHEVARVIGKLMGEEPVILDEPASAGRTVIEKFEDHADEVGFAVVLLTPDEVGGPKGGQQQPRTRQNVIFELGYFAKLGRAHVCRLEPGWLTTSDIAGLVYISLSESWEFKLGKEMRAAGIPADLNAI